MAVDVREPGKKRRPRGVATKRLYVIRLDRAVLEVGRFRKANPDHRADNLLDVAPLAPIRMTRSSSTWPANLRSWSVIRLASTAHYAEPAGVHWTSRGGAERARRKLRARATRLQNLRRS